VDVLGHNLVVSGRYCLDVGASTGGFTDCLLSRGARGVVAIDSGRAQLHASLVSNPRVDLRERTVARDLEQRSLAGPIELVVADVSFCGLVQAIAPAIALTSESAEFVLLVKPQFESTQAEMAGSGGVVRDPALWTSAMLRVEHGLLSLGLAPVAWSLASPAGPKGNREFFVRARRFSVMDAHLGPSRLDTTLAAARSLARAAIAAAIAEGMPSRRS
jgi:23S rRNA (cytidine1920-2'-O)/16S rRNA (cytidine1409-2'-O)-methyltransferase